MELKKVKYSVQGPIATVSMDSPKNLNAFNEELIDELVEALRLCQEDGNVKAVVLNSTGKAFSAGGDIGAMYQGIKTGKLVNGYGMTEIGASNLIPPINEVTIPELRRKWDAAGKPLFFNQVRVVDESLRDVPVGERGELVWKGNLTFSGYWNAPQASREMFTPDGWVRSGDIGYCDEEGYYYICGRIKNMFISGGENIFPLEIETVIAGHPDVQECCVIGVPDGRWGEVGKALVVLRPGCVMEAKTVKKLAAAELSSIKIPKYVSFVSDIPRNAVGKRDLAAIMERFGAPEGDG